MIGFFLPLRFEQAGEVASISFCKDNATNKSLGSAYVRYREEVRKEAAKAALETLNSTEINGKPIEIQLCTEAAASLKTNSNVGNIFVKNLDLSIDSEVSGWKSVSLVSMYMHTHTHTHTRRERERERNTKGFGFLACTLFQALREAFSQFGNISSCKVATDVSGKPKGTGYINFEEEAAAKKAIESMNDTKLKVFDVGIWRQGGRKRRGV